VRIHSGPGDSVSIKRPDIHSRLSSDQGSCLLDWGESIYKPAGRKKEEDRFLMDLLDNRSRLGWAIYASLDHELVNPEFREEALDVARGITRLVRARLEAIVDRLIARDYRFQYPDDVLKSPIELEAAQWVEQFERNGLHLPISFQAWVEEVGSVNLIGQDPSWPSLSTIETNASGRVLADPLQVEYDLDYFTSELEAWKDNCDEFGNESAGPFVISFSADDLHKADISGGSEYGLDASRPIVDPVVLYERHSLRFLPYVLTSLTYGGFIGFDQFEEQMHPFVSELLAGLD
jgi:hypothetical protein